MPYPLEDPYLSLYRPCLDESCEIRPCHDYNGYIDTISDHRHISKNFGVLQKHLFRCDNLEDHRCHLPSHYLRDVENILSMYSKSHHDVRNINDTNQMSEHYTYSNYSYDGVETQSYSTAGQFILYIRSCMRNFYYMYTQRVNIGPVHFYVYLLAAMST